MSQTANRREFVKTTSLAVGATAALGTMRAVHSMAAEPKTRLNLGIIGCGGIMTHHVKGLVGRRENVNLAWLCDVDEAQIARMAGHAGNHKPRKTARYEDVIQDKNVDAVIIATPHHWHAPIAMAAMAEGKDTYIEKPISHVFDEGPQIIAAAKKYRRVVQQGSQMRSSPVTAKAAKLLADGVIGDIKVARAWTAETRGRTEASFRMYCPSPPSNFSK